MRKRKNYVPDLTLKEAQTLFLYCEETGKLSWREQEKREMPVGRNHNGYCVICIRGWTYRHHRIAWLLKTGEWPSDMIDHINGKRDDNRWVNLRNVTNKVNQQNIRKPRADNKTGLIGAQRYRNKFRAKIRVDGKIKQLGIFDTPEEASACYLEGKRVLHEGNTL